MIDKLVGQLKSVLAKRTAAKIPEPQPAAPIRPLNKGGAETLDQLPTQDAGGEPVKETGVVFMAAFGDQAAADDLVAMSRDACDCTRAEVIAEDGGSQPYLAAVELRIMPSPATIRSIEETMTELAQSMGGVSRGWRVFASEAKAAADTAPEQAGQQPASDPVAEAVNASAPDEPETLFLPAPGQHDEQAA